MSFIASETGRGFEAGYFLVDNEDCTRLTQLIPPNHAQVVTRADGTKIVPAGAIYPANGATAVGILYEDVDVTGGTAMPGSVVTRGSVYMSILPTQPVEAAVTALKGNGINFVTAFPDVTRPQFEPAT